MHNAIICEPAPPQPEPPELTEAGAADLFCAIVAAKAAQQRNDAITPKYAVFLGDDLHPVTDDMYRRPGDARKNLNRLVDFWLWYYGRHNQENPSAEDCRRVWQLIEADPRAKKKLVDAAIARGLVSIKEVVPAQGRRTAGLV